ncbi:MAG: pilus assembly protein, partial [Lachnospiraceae bacterium]|nr:pilus assembly protein [Lachnospiraceae bacterium]
MAESLGLTYLVAAGKVRAKLGTAYLENSLLAGASSISWLRSSVMQKEDCIDLVAEYQMKPPSAVAGWKQRTMYSRMRTRAWTGYDHAGSGGSSQSNEEEIVYITPEGTVYHRSRGCSYLKLSIAAVDKSFLETQRNHNGEKYYPCGECGASGGSVVYITGYGNRYHATLGCSSLKRTILAVPISETGGRGACSKCG